VADETEAPIFIVGCGRSGTTLLRLMLNRHPRIAIPGETWYFPDLDRLRQELASQPEQVWRGQVVDYIVRSATFPELGITRELIVEQLNSAARSQWGKVLSAANVAFARLEGKARWGDKTPGYVRHLPLLASEFPSAFILHMIRDPRDVAASFFEQPFGPKTPIEAGAYWKRDVARGQRDGPSYFGDRYMEIRYEELVADPETVIRQVLTCVGEPYDQRVLEQHDGASEYLVPEHHWHNLATKPVTRSRVARWRETLSPRDAQLIELETGQLLRDLGYPPVDKKSILTIGEWLLDRARRAVRRLLTDIKVAAYRTVKRAKPVT
jgi:hypothetical protein